MTRMIQAAILLIAIVLLNSCDKKGGDNVTGVTITSASIVPLVVGNQWVYTDSTFSATAPVHVDSSKLGITGKISISFQSQSVEVFYWNWYDIRTNQAQDYKWLGRNESDGYYMFGGASTQI